MLLLFVASAIGCGKTQADVDSGINSFVQKLLVKRTPQQRAIEALQTENADDRRKYLRDVLKDDQATAEWAVKVFASVAKTDPDPQVRCLAIKGLRKAADDRVIEPLMMILNQKEFPAKVTPPQPVVRWEATEVVAFMLDLGEVPEEHRGWATETLIRLLGGDSDRNVRIEAARGLGNCHDDRAINALVRALEMDESDFGICQTVERSLEKLTGERHEYDADLWREWLAKRKEASTSQPAE
jgi:HEAT repeat protein